MLIAKWYELYAEANKMVAAQVLRNLMAAISYKIHTVLTDNGIQFTKLIRSPVSQAWRHVAPGRRVPHHQWQAAFPLACGGLGLNQRAETSYPPTRQRERRMQRVTSAGHAQRFLATDGPLAQHVRPRRHRLSAAEYRQGMSHRFDTWRELTSLPTAA